MSNVTPAPQKETIAMSMIYNVEGGLGEFETHRRECSGPHKNAWQNGGQKG